MIWSGAILAEDHYMHMCNSMQDGTDDAPVQSVAPVIASFTVRATGASSRFEGLKRALPSEELEVILGAGEGLRR